MTKKEIVVFDESDSKLRAVSIDSITGLGQVIEQVIIDELQPFNYYDAEQYLKGKRIRVNPDTTTITLKKDQDGIYRPTK